MDAVAGARRTPGRLKTGGVPPKPPATILLSLWPSVFWDFGSLFSSFRGHFLPRLCVAAQASRTSHSRCCCSSRRCGVLYHVMSRQACLLLQRRCGVTVCLQSRRRQPDVAASPGVAVPLVSAGCRGNCWRVVVHRAVRQLSFPLASLTVVCPTFSFPEDALYLSWPASFVSSLRRLRRTFLVHLHQVA